MWYSDSPNLGANQMFELIFNVYRDGKITREAAIEQMVSLVTDQNTVQLTILMSDLFTGVQARQ